MKKYLNSSLRVLFPETCCTDDTLTVSGWQCRHRRVLDLAEIDAHQGFAVVPPGPGLGPVDNGDGQPVIVAEIE
jgi:hypothetical protein